MNINWKFLKEIVESAGFDITNFAKECGVDASTIHRFYNNDVKRPNPKTVHAFATSLNRTVEQLYTDLQKLQQQSAQKPAARASNFTIPRVSRVSAGVGADFVADLNEEDGVPGALYPYPLHDPMAIRVQGDSMVGPNRLQGIAPGDDVIIANGHDEEIAPKMLVVAMRRSSDETFIKFVKEINDDRVVLESLNQDYADITISREDVVLRPVKVIVRYPYRRK